MENKKSHRLSMNLTQEDQDLLMSAKLYFEKRTGLSIPITQAIRLAIRSFARQEREYGA